jgi:hypothetical protein
MHGMQIMVRLGSMPLRTAIFTAFEASSCHDFLTDRIAIEFLRAAGILSISAEQLRHHQ